MSEQTKEKVPFKTKVRNLGTEFKTHWNTPAEGKYVPYKEYLSIFAAVGGNYSAAYLLGFLSFGTGCYLVAFYYEIPIPDLYRHQRLFHCFRLFLEHSEYGCRCELGFSAEEDGAEIQRRLSDLYRLRTAVCLFGFFFDPAVPRSGRQLCKHQMAGTESLQHL